MVAQLYGYGEVITPVVESYDLLAAKAGEEIRERMYAFKDFGGRKVALRPEFTASVARLVATKMRTEPKPMRFFSVGSLYRYDEPQYGRFREFWQANYELFGSTQPEADAEILMLTNDLLRKLGLRNYGFKIGHMGILRGILSQEGLKEGQQNSIMQLLDKKRWREALRIAQNAGASGDCLKTLEKVFETKGKKVSQVLKRAEESVKDYSSAVDAVGNLREILELVRESGVKLEVLIEAGFARGLEYYTGMVFEPYVQEIGMALSGGGRYDKLIELFGGESIPAVGVAQGVDRIVLAMNKQGVPSKAEKERKVFVVSVKEESRARAVSLASMLRDTGFAVEVEVMRRSVSSALSDADRRAVAYAVIVGPDELKEEKVVLRDMKKREQRVVEIENLCEEISGDLE